MLCAGLTAFDFIMDYDEWIECGYFSDEIRARLKGTYSHPTATAVITLVHHCYAFCCG